MNSALLEYEMKRRHVSDSKLCKEINISRSAFYRKKTGQSEFTRKEIQGICDVLQLESPMAIFFTD